MRALKEEAGVREGEEEERRERVENKNGGE